MSANDVVLLDGMLKKSRQQTSAALSNNDHNTFWVAQQYLKHYGIGQDDVVAGIVDGSHDCGLDGIYTFVNGLHLTDDTPVDKLGRQALLDLFLLQVKDTSGFAEDAIDKLIANLPRLLSFDRDESQLPQYANPRIIELTRRFLRAYRDLEMPTLKIFIAFASLRASSNVHANIKLKAEALQRTCGELFTGCPIEVIFLDAAGLCEWARDAPRTTRKLQLAENPISTDTAGGYIGVVRLNDYESFLTSERGELDTSLFEANVRDYEGETAVNRSIEATLATRDDAVDFWWLNNGVTIVASKVQLANKLLELETPQIVNGLQTSTEIYKRVRTVGKDADRRSVLVKVIEARDEAVRENIIRATNSQTAFGPSALRATDKVQRQVEEYLQGRGLWYERRRRHYFNLNKPLDRIVSIDTMGQALLSVAAQMPHVARGTASRVFDEDIYPLVFHPDYPVEMYAATIDLQRQCDTWLKRAVPEAQVEDYRFHLSMLAASALTRKMQPNRSDLAGLLNMELTTGLAAELLSDIRQVYEREARKVGAVLFDQLAKSPKVTEALLAKSKTRLLGTRRPDERAH
ncbi:MAG: hypothetical protein JWO62_1161 [Acidimicrobiaceae bacterium]|nr:hypothetical protein [Acidimicrobiaceae bacterium]